MTTTTSKQLYPPTYGDDLDVTVSASLNPEQPMGFESDDRDTGRRALIVSAAVGGAVALGLGTYGRIHQPTGAGIFTLGFPAVLPMKVWLTTGAFGLGLGQIVSALWMWGRLPGLGPAPRWVSSAHRGTGTLAFLVTLPVAYHCLWALGFQATSTRTLTHSLLGCAFYGVFTTKMLGLRSQRFPKWAIPVLGGLLVTVLTGLWLTSSLWFFTNQGFPRF